MTAKRFVVTLALLGYSLHDAHEILGIARSTVFRIANGTSKVPTHVEKLLDMYLKHGVPK